MWKQISSKYECSDDGHIRNRKSKHILKEFDGGYIYENKFEELKDWQTIPDLKFLSQSRADVCPSCYEEYKRILTKYYSSGENLAPVDDIKTI